MVPRLSSRSERSDGRGRSFRDLSKYLFQGEAHRPAPDRVLWAQAINSRISDPAEAWREMAWTAEHAAELKEAAGVRRGGRKNEAPVWHVSLNWHESERPTPEEMQAAGLEVLQRFGLEQHQAVMVAHGDTGHPHLHLMVNLVSHEDGRSVDVSKNTKRRLSAWALDYDRERGNEHCPQREINAEKRANNRAAYDAAHTFAKATGQDMAPLRITRDDSAHRELWNAMKRAREQGANAEGIEQIREIHRDMWQQYYEQSKDKETERLQHPDKTILEQLTRLDVSFTRQELAKRVANATGSMEEFQALFAKVEAQVVDLPQTKNRLTTHEMAQIEKDMAQAVADMAASSAHGLNGGGERTKLRAKGLGAEQRAALEHVTTGAGLACVVGYAGTGKSTMLAEARAAWEVSGYRVLGATLSGIAAEGLEGGSGIKSRTLHGLQWALDHGREALTDKDVLVVDEAGMIGSRQMHRLLTTAQAAGAKVVLVGDPQQLQSIEAGGAFRAIVERTGAAEITAVRRQRQDWQQQATVDLASGRVGAALDAYSREKKVRAHDDQAEAIEALVTDWTADHIAGRSSIMLAVSRANVAALNAEARETLREQGRLGDDIEIPACEEGIDQPRRDFRLKVAEGERLLFTKNDKRLGVKNGTIGTLEKARGGRLMVRLDGDKPRLVEVDLSAYRNLDYGYALTVHKAQGATVDTAHVLASRGMDKHSAYVALSRHRDSVKLHYALDEFRGPMHLERRLSRDRPKESTLDYFAGERGRARTMQEERARVRKAAQRRTSDEKPRDSAADYWKRKGQIKSTLGRTR
ncbi:AAA family ATPase [Pseudogemmobacter sonorensis]|uniref:AAA family ATPase n=1 Tax=Pseudogemmobacter sonorensis TaxID=2989681 RepID=UPI003689297D